mmetsp:Transcript_12500/g.27778  ORF Transcript_12500/g.27778 Transcript_12500/m.27778 type:complete len:209 (-) Transcript_12500:35-661(-)
MRCTSAAALVTLSADASANSAPLSSCPTSSSASLARSRSSAAALRVGASTSAVARAAPSAPTSSTRVTASPLSQSATAPATMPHSLSAPACWSSKSPSSCLSRAWGAAAAGRSSTTGVRVPCSRPTSSATSASSTPCPSSPACAASLRAAIAPASFVRASAACRKTSSSSSGRMITSPCSCPNFEKRDAKLARAATSCRSASPSSPSL